MLAQWYSASNFACKTGGPHMHETHHDDEIDLFTALASIESRDEAKSFLMDLCTPSEIKAFIERWRVCQLLNDTGFSYRKIREITGASLMTIGRVARFLNDEPYCGYKKILDKNRKI
jgi:TrpR-related protein YerC/YecD